VLVRWRPVREERPPQILEVSLKTSSYQYLKAADKLGAPEMRQVVPAQGSGTVEQTLFAAQ
jgi:hypothetical protein